MEARTAVATPPVAAPGSGSPGWRPPLAAALALVSVACCVLARPLSEWLSTRTYVAPALWGDLVLGMAWPVAGALVVRAAPRNPVGWILVSAALVGPYHVAGYYAAIAGLPGRDLPLADLAAWVAVWGFAPYFYVLPLTLLLFPDGRALTRRWRAVVVGVLVVAGVTVVSRMLAPVTTDIAPGVANPWSVPWPWLRPVTLTGSMTCIFVGNLLGLVSVLLRTRRAVGRHRAQMQWLLLGGTLLVVGFVLPVPGDSWREIVMAIGLLGPPVAIAIAILRHGLLDVEVALNRTLVLVVVSALVVSAYAGAVLLLGSVGATSGPGLLLVAGAALAAAGGRTVVQRAVDRLLFGHRRDPYAVVARVGRHIAPADEADEALRLLVDALRRALRLPWVAFVDPAGREVAAAGRPVPTWHAERAVVLGQPMGELRAGLRRPGERLGAEELGAIAEVASRAATLAYAGRLVADVSASRARIVTAREEERRRLRDDLHDGLGPTLAGTAHQLEALVTRLRRTGDDVGADRAAAIRDRLRATVTDVRSIVHGLRPPVLDQRGLAGALAGLVEDIDSPECHTELRLPPVLPAAVEVATYAIAAEAVTNALRHSAGSTLSMVAGVEDRALVLTVDDNGQGLHGPAGHGIGLRSMSERAAEVGGRCEVGVAPGGGCRVRVTIPLQEGARS